MLNLKRKSVNKAARGKGAKAEILLANQLTAQGYEVRRTHLSAFPDIIAWNADSVLMIEVKSRSSPKTIKPAVNMFVHSVKELSTLCNHAILLCYVLHDNQWHAYQWVDNAVTETQAMV